jgi:poly(3-hydroxybutyrate) depolymerase
MRRLLTMSLLLATFLAAHGAAVQTNPLGGLIEPAIDWSGYPRPVKTGKSTDELKHPATKAFIMKYLMWAPEKLPEKRHLGLLVCFHGFNGNEGHFGWAYDSMKAAGLGERYVVLSLKSKGAGWAKEDESEVLKTLDWVKSVYPIDPRRVFIWGMSNGGWMVSEFGGKHQDSIAGIVRYCGYPPTVPALKDAAMTQSEYYLVHGDADKDVSVDGSRNLRRSLMQNGYRYVYREIDGGGHVDIINHTNVRLDICRWIDALRHKQLPLTPEEEKYLKQLGDTKKADAALKKAETWGEVLRIGGPHAGQVVARAFKSDSATVRENAALACTQGAFAGDQTVAGLIPLLDDKNPGVRQAALNALGMFANWRYEQAQLALGKIAVKAKGELNERGGATMLLANAARMPLLGNLDDDMPVFQALLTLMDDGVKGLREAAFAPLHEAVKDGLGYDPGTTDKERAGPIGKWMEWLNSKASAEGKGQKR